MYCKTRTLHEISYTIRNYHTRQSEVELLYNRHLWLHVRSQETISVWPNPRRERIKSEVVNWSYVLQQLEVGFAASNTRRSAVNWPRGTDRARTTTARPAQAVPEGSRATPPTPAAAVGLYRRRSARSRVRTRLGIIDASPPEKLLTFDRQLSYWPTQLIPRLECLSVIFPMHGYLSAVPPEKLPTLKFAPPRGPTLNPKT